MQGEAYQNSLRALDANLNIFARACPLWVTLAEMGDCQSDLAQQILSQDLPGADGPNTILLGCTHFPVFRETISRLRPTLNIVDSASTTVQWVSERLTQLDLLRAERSAERTESGGGAIQFLATDGVDRFQKVAGVFFGQPVDHVQLVDL